MYFLLNQLYLHGQILLFMLTNIKMGKGALSCRLGFSTLLLLNRRKGLNALLSLKPRRLFISFARTKETKQRKFAVCTFLPTPALFYAKQKELAVAQTAFCF